MSRRLTILRAFMVALFLVSAGYLALVLRRMVIPRPQPLSVAVVILGFWLTFELGWAVAQRVRRRIGWVSLVGRWALCGGLVTVFASGLANYYLRMSGFVLMVEGDAAPFFHGKHVQEFDAGFLSDPMEMDLVLHLKEVELRDTEGGGFMPVSHLILARGGQKPHAFELAPGAAVADGPLIFHQGAFGYGARVVIAQKGETLFDQTVPFTTQRDGGEGTVSFVVEFNVRAHQLNVQAEILLDTLDKELRGHPRMVAAVRREGELLGTGTLRMGHFADLEEGVRIGFAGMTKWSEIDISRRNYPELLTVGGWIAAAGLLILVAGGIVRRVRR